MLNLFCNNLELEIGVEAKNTHNYDETGFHDVPTRRKLIFRRGCRNPERIRNSTKSYYTIVFCGNAEGQFVPPYVIIKGANSQYVA